MKDNMEVCRIVYEVLKIHIQFGVYHDGDILPTMEQSADNFLVSIDTVRSAYLQLQREGYVRLSPNVGSMVVKDYSDEETEFFIQQFFSRRRNALIDLSKSIRPLFSNAQWIGLKNAPAEIYQNMQRLMEGRELQPFIVFKHIIEAYNSLNNDLLLRLLWRIFTFYEAPFFCVPRNPWCTFAVEEYSPWTLDACLKQNWGPLRESICNAQDSLSVALKQFYDDRITLPPSQPEIPFSCSVYKKASQLRYSLAMDLLTAISIGQYPAGTMLPSLKQLSQERNVSVSTLRRTLALLNGVGATESIQWVGTKVLPFHETASHCDFSNPAIRRRLMDMAQSMQVLTLSCKSVAEVTITSLDTAGLQKCRERLSTIRARGQYELVTYITLELLEQLAPYQAIRTVYRELLRQLFWGYSLRSIWKASGDNIRFYLSCFDAFMGSLEQGDADKFSDHLERLMVHEFHFMIHNLVQLGVTEAGELLISDIQ